VVPPKAGVKPKAFGAKPSQSAPAKPSGSIARLLDKVRQTASGVAARVTGQGGGKKAVAKSKDD